MTGIILKYVHMLFWCFQIKYLAKRIFINFLEIKIMLLFLQYDTFFVTLMSNL